MALVGGGGSLVLSDRLVKMLQLSLNTHVNPINASHNDSDNKSLVDSPPSTVSTSADEMTNERVRELLAHNLNSDNHQAELWLFSFVAFQVRFLDVKVRLLHSQVSVGYPAGLA